MPSFPKTLPVARTPPSEAAPVLRWGVLGTGWIADRFIRSLRRHTRQQLLAVGSRDADRSADFARRHGLSRAYDSYEELAADPDLDVVYVATPHPGHHPCATLALEAGKHVLVEKPLALNARPRPEGFPRFLVAAMVSAMVGGLVAVAGRTTASQPSAGEVRLQAPWEDPSCRELIALPKRGWICEHHRP
jgi:Oxidoreductase family, NAD-binding Rossmann fold